MKEHEYSFKVKNLKPYIDYCINNNYLLNEETTQHRTLYRKKDKTIARITLDEKNGNKKMTLDFKDDILSEEALITRRESLPIEITDEKAVNSILDFLNYKKDNTLFRKRLIYDNGKVKFEFDEYIEPEKCYVVAFEGNINEIKAVYEEIKKINEIYEK